MARHRVRALGGRGRSGGAPRARRARDPLERAWTPHGTLAADLHVHAHASSDSRLPNPQRVVAQVAAGIEVIALSDHNTNGDLDAEITGLGLDDVVASIASNELSNDTMHLGVYPVRVDRDKPRGGSPSDQVVSRATVPQLFELARGLGDRPILQVNHPRFRYTALFDSTRWNGVTWPPPFPLGFEAFEVLAGYSAANVPGDRRIDDSVRDLFTFVDHGHLVAPVGNSDTHDLNWVLDGTARTYVFADAPRFDEASFIAALRNRRVVATTGPWIDLEVAPHEGATPTVGPGQSVVASGSLWVDVTISQARFVRTERIRITTGSATGPMLAQTIDVPTDIRSFHWAGRIALESTDTWVAVTADGDTALPLELTGTYQRDKWKRAGVTPYAVASPILVDVDGDGWWKRGAANVSLRDAER
ncbi:MAG: CehA/McbA family metallohydrolase [Kofleriaceae bacterium]